MQQEPDANPRQKHQHRGVLLRRRRQSTEGCPTASTDPPEDRSVQGSSWRGCAELTTSDSPVARLSHTDRNLPEVRHPEWLIVTEILKLATKPCTSLLLVNHVKISSFGNTIS